MKKWNKHLGGHKLPSCQKRGGVSWVTDCWCDGNHKWRLRWWNLSCNSRWSQNTLMLHLCSALPPRLCLDLYLPFFLALLYFYLLWLLRLSSPYLTPAAQYDSVAIIASDLFGPVRELWKKYNCLFGIRPDSSDSADSADSIFGYIFDSDSIGYSLFFSSVRSGSDPVPDSITVGYN